MRWLLALVGVLAVALAVQAASGAKPDQASAPVRPSNCETPSEALVVRLSEGLKAGVTLENMQAVKSADYSNVYFVSAVIVGPGVSGRPTGTWATNRLDGSGVTYSVDGYANQFSPWGDGGKTQAAFSMSRNGARASADCAKTPSP